MAARLYVVQDDLFFAERVRLAATRVGLEPVALTPVQAGERAWEPGSVVAVQVTLNPERQLALIARLAQAEPAPRVVAITGHLETGLRERARALGAILAAHSSMDRALARACGVSGGRDADAGAPRR